MGNKPRDWLCMHSLRGDSVSDLVLFLLMNVIERCLSVNVLDYANLLLYVPPSVVLARG